MARLSRRQFLSVAALSLMPAALATCSLTRTQATRMPQPLPLLTAEPAGAATAERPAAFGVGPSVSITPNSEFYTVAITQRSDWLTAETYTLTVSGAVVRPLKLTLTDLKALPAVEQMRTLECIGNPAGGGLISNAMWKGVRMADVLWKAGLTSAAVEIKLVSADGYVTSVPVALATRPDALLVYEMNGQPLPDEHGAPLRALFPGRYGMK